MAIPVRLAGGRRADDPVGLESTDLVIGEPEFSQTPRGCAGRVAVRAIGAPGPVRGSNRNGIVVCLVTG